MRQPEHARRRLVSIGVCCLLACTAGLATFAAPANAETPVPTPTASDGAPASPSTPTPTGVPSQVPSSVPTTSSPDAVKDETPSLAQMNAAHDHTMGSTVPEHTTAVTQSAQSAPAPSQDESGPVPPQPSQSDAPSAAGTSTDRFAAASLIKAAVPSGTLGLDVSGWQTLSRANWTTIYSQGARFAYVKATEGTTYTSSQFSEQYNDSYAAGLIRGAYHFATPDTSSGTAQATYFVAHGGGWSADGKTLPPLLDIEYNPYGATCYGLSQAQMVSWITDFSNTVQALTGRLPAIYSTTDWWTQCTGNSGVFVNNPLFIARYTSNVAGGPGTLPASWYQYTFWQFADSGTFPGDQDVFNGSLLDLQTFAATNPVKTTQPAVAPSLGRNVALAETTAGKVYLFWKGNNGDLWIKTKSGSSWSASTDTGRWIGPGSGLSASVNPSGSFVVIWRGGDAGIWMTTSTNGSSWSALKEIPAAGPTATPGAPAVAIAANGTIYVFWKGQNNRLYQAVGSPTGTWSGYISLGADIGPGTALSAGIDQAGWTYVFWRGGDSNLWEANWTGHSWTLQHKIPATGRAGGVQSEVGVAVTPDAVQYVFWRGLDKRLYQAIWDGHAWRGYYSLGANVGPGTAVSASLDGKNATSVYWQGGDNGIWGAYWTGSSWTGAQSAPAG